MFSILEGDKIILWQGGVATQNDLYVRGDELFAKKGSGFIRVCAENKTSVPKVTWDQIISEVPLVVGPFGRLRVVR